MAAKKNKKANEESQKIEELENQVKRSLADYQNLEKRTREERVNWIKTANKDFILRLLPTLDHMEAALMGAAEKGEISGWFSGVEIAVKEFKKVLQEEGLEPISAEAFDPNLHEAISAQPGPEGVVLKVLQNGYTLNGKLVRPAKVIVGNGE